MKKTFISLLIISAVLSLCSCAEIKLTTPLSDETLVKIEDETCSTAEGVFRLMEVVASYGGADESFLERSVDDMTMEEYIMESVQEEMTTLTAVVLMADSMAVYLTDEELEESAAAAQEAYAEISAEYDTEAYGITLETAESLYEKQALYEKIYSSLTESVTMEISESDTKVIEVNFVLFPEDTTLDEAETLRTEINSGASFQTACENADYTPYMNITIKKGDMVSAFENVAFALKDGELSECTETVDGIYLIECVEDYLANESAANYNSVVTEAKDEVFDEAYNEFSDGRELEFNTSVWNSIDIT